MIFGALWEMMNDVDSHNTKLRSKKASVRPVKSVSGCNYMCYF